MTDAFAHPFRKVFLAEVERRYGDLITQDLAEDTDWFNQFCDATVTTEDEARAAALKFGEEYDLDDISSLSF